MPLHHLGLYDDNLIIIYLANLSTGKHVSVSTLDSILGARNCKTSVHHTTIACLGEIRKVHFMLNLADYHKSFRCVLTKLSHSIVYCEFAERVSLWFSIAYFLRSFCWWNHQFQMIPFSGPLKIDFRVPSGVQTTGDFHGKSDSGCLGFNYC